jgi:DNA-binding response OmpR family regulator
METALEESRGLEANGGGLPAILIVDYHLDDDITGIEVIRELRALWGTRVPAIIVTADHSESVRDEIRESGEAILHKPIKPAALRALLSRMLTRQ